MVQSAGDMEVLAIDTIHRPLTVAEFNKMVEVGIIAPDEPVELVDGELIAMPRMGPPHASIVGRLTNVLLNRLRAAVTIWPQLPVVTSQWSQPQPDVALVRPREDFYRSGHPIPEDIFAVVEVSDSMLAFDRGPKRRMYAKAAIAEYWIVDVKAMTIEAYREPHDIGYGVPLLAARGQAIAFAAFPDITFAVEELIG
jgi:Uma2 family endonuclease